MKSIQESVREIRTKSALTQNNTSITAHSFEKVKTLKTFVIAFIYTDGNGWAIVNAETSTEAEEVFKAETKYPDTTIISVKETKWCGNNSHIIFEGSVTTYNNVDITVTLEDLINNTDAFETVDEYLRSLYDLSDYITRSELASAVADEVSNLNIHDGATPEIDPITYHWIIGGVDTGVTAKGENGYDGAPGAPGADGEDGHSPEVIINEAGYWCIDGNNTGVKAKGEDGVVTLENMENVRLAASAQINERAGYSEGLYFLILNDAQHSTLNSGRRVGDSFTPYTTVNYGVDGKKWAKIEVDVKAGDEFDIYGEARAVRRTTGNQQWVCMPLFWICDSNNIIKTIYPALPPQDPREYIPGDDVLPYDVTGNTAPQYNCLYTKENPYHVTIQENGKLYFNSYVGDAFDVTTVQNLGNQSLDQDDEGNAPKPEEVGNSSEAIIEGLFGVIRQYEMTASLTESGSLALEGIEGYSDDYIDKDYYTNDEIDFLVRQQRATDCRRFLQSAIDFASNIGAQLVFPKNKTFIIHISKPLSIPGNFTLNLNGSTILAFTNSFNSSCVVTVPYNSPNVTIKNGCIYGDRLTHIIPQGDTKSHEYNFAITVSGTGFLALNLKVGYVTGDGFYICGDVAWNHLKPINSSTFSRGTIDISVDSLGYYTSSAGTFIAGTSDSCVTDFLNLEYYKSTYPIALREKCAIVPRPVGRIPDLNYKVGRNYICAYYSLNDGALDNGNSNNYTFISKEKLTWGDMLNIPEGATHFRLVFDIDKTKNLNTLNFVLWIALIIPVYGVHIDTCEILFCGRNGICPTAIRKCVIDKCQIHDIWGTNNRVGIDFENTSYIDKDCIVKDTRLWRCGAKYDPKCSPNAPNGGCIIFSQGAHYVIDNCECEGPISGGNEDVHIYNTRCSSIGLSARGEVNVSNIKNTIDNCVVAGHIKAFNSIIRNCEMDMATSLGHIPSTFEDCNIQSSIGTGIYNRCKINNTNIYSLHSTSNIIQLFNCTFNTTGWSRTYTEDITVDVVNCTIHHYKTESGEVGPFNASFRTFKDNTMYLEGGNVWNVPWCLYSDPQGLTFTGNRLIDVNDKVCTSPIKLDITSATKPCIMSNNIFERRNSYTPTAQTDYIKVLLGTLPLYFYDNIIDSPLRMYRDIRVHSSLGGNLYRRNTRQTSTDTVPYPDETTIAAVNSTNYTMGINTVNL